MIEVRIIPSPYIFVVCGGGEDVTGERAEWRHPDLQENGRIKVAIGSLAVRLIVISVSYATTK